MFKTVLFLTINWSFNVHCAPSFVRFAFTKTFQNVGTNCFHQSEFEVLSMFIFNPHIYVQSKWLLWIILRREISTSTKCVSNMWCDNVMSTVCLHIIKLYETILTIFSVGLIHWKWDTSHWATAAKIYWANKSFLFETWINFMCIMYNRSEAKVQCFWRLLRDVLFRHSLRLGRGRWTSWRPSSRTVRYSILQYIIAIRSTL